MRFNRQVIFVTEGKERYNPRTGDYDLGESEEKMMWGNVSHLGLERREVVFGDVRTDGVVMRFRHQIPKHDYILFNGKKYRADTKNIFRNKTALIASEVQ